MEPLTQYIVPAMLGVTAVILLIAGGRLLKPALGLSGFLIGAGLGLYIAPKLSFDISPFIVAAFTGIFVAMTSVVIAKFAILLILGVGCAIVTPYLTWQLAGFGDVTQVASDVVAAATTTPEEVQQNETEDAVIPSTPEEIISLAFSGIWSNASATINEGMARANAAWNVIPSNQRLMLIGSAIAGLLLGLLIATFMPFTATAIVTSIGGSMLLLLTIKEIATIQFAANPFSSMSTTGFTSTIAGIALAGFALQMTLFKNPPNAKLKKK